MVRIVTASRVSILTVNACESRWLLSQDNTVRVPSHLIPYLSILAIHSNNKYIIQSLGWGWTMSSNCAGLSDDGCIVYVLQVGCEREARLFR